MKMKLNYYSLKHSVRNVLMVPVMGIFVIVAMFNTVQAQTDGSATCADVVLGLANFCYDNDLTDSFVFEMCPDDPADILSVELVTGELEAGFDSMDVYSGVSGSGAGGVEVVADLDGDLEGQILTALAAGDCLAFVVTSDGSVACADGDFEAIGVQCAAAGSSFGDALVVECDDASFTYCHPDEQNTASPVGNAQYGQESDVVIVPDNPCQLVTVEILEGGTDNAWWNGLTVWSSEDGSPSGTILFQTVTGTGGVFGDEQDLSGLVVVSAAPGEIISFDFVTDGPCNFNTLAPNGVIANVYCEVDATLPMCIVGESGPCDDAGTENSVDDDFYSFTATVYSATGSAVGFNWTLGGQAGSSTYGTEFIIDGLLIADGDDTFTATDAVDATITDSADVTPPTACSVGATPSPQDPCICAGDGEFNENFQIVNDLDGDGVADGDVNAGEVWTVTASTSHPQLIGQTLNFGDGDGDGFTDYTISFTHLDGVGYDIQVTGPNGGGSLVLDFASTCFYPTFSYTVFPDQDAYCNTEAPFQVILTGANGSDGTATTGTWSLVGNPPGITIAGNIATVDPAASGVGLTFTVAFDQDDAGAPDPGCTVEQDVFVPVVLCDCSPEVTGLQDAICASDECYTATTTEYHDSGFWIITMPGDDTIDPVANGTFTDNGDGTIGICPQTTQNDLTGTYEVTYTVPPTSPSGCGPLAVTEWITIYPSYDACFAVEGAACPGADVIITTNDWNPESSQFYVNGVDVTANLTMIDTDGDFINDAYVWAAPALPGSYTLVHNIGSDICQTTCTQTIIVVGTADAGILQDNVVCQSTDDWSINLNQYLAPGPVANGGTWQLARMKPFINEVEYSNVDGYDDAAGAQNNVGTDWRVSNDISVDRDWIEIAGEAGTDLSEYMIALYQASPETAIDQIGEANGAVYAILVPGLGFGYYVNYNDSVEVWSEQWCIAENACEPGCEIDPQQTCCQPARFDLNNDKWCVLPDVLDAYRVVDPTPFLPGVCSNCTQNNGGVPVWDDDVFPIRMVNNGLPTATTVIDAEFTAANGNSYGSLAIELGFHKDVNNNICNYDSNHGGDILSGPAGIALVYMGDPGEALGGTTPWFDEPNFFCDNQQYEVCQFIGYGEAFGEYEDANGDDVFGVHDPNNPIANGDSDNSYFADNGINNDFSYNLVDPSDEPWNPDDFNGNDGEHEGLYSNKGIFTACDGPAASLTSTDVNVVDHEDLDVGITMTGNWMGTDFNLPGPRAIQFTNDCWVIPNITDNEINYPLWDWHYTTYNPFYLPAGISMCANFTSNTNTALAGEWSEEYYTPGNLNWGQLGAGMTSLSSGCNDSSPEEFYFDLVAPNAEILDLSNFCPTLFVGGLVVTEEDVYTSGLGDGDFPSGGNITQGEGGLPTSDEILFDFRKNQVYPICFDYGFPPVAEDCVDDSNYACIYILMDYEEEWEAPQFLCEANGPVNLNTLHMDSLQFIPPHKVEGRFAGTLTNTFAENLKAPKLTEVNYIYEDILNNGTNPNVTTDNHCVTYRWRDDSGTPFDITDDQIESTYFCEGVEISAEEGTELSCYGLVFYAESDIYEDDSDLIAQGMDYNSLGMIPGHPNSLAVDVVYIGADGLPHETNVSNGKYMQLYGNVDTDGKDQFDDRNGDGIIDELITVYGLNDLGTFNQIILGTANSTTEVPNNDIWGNKPVYNGWDNFNPTNIYGNNTGGVNANMPLWGGLFWDVNQDGEFDATEDVPTNALSFPWERAAECPLSTDDEFTFADGSPGSTKCGVGSRWFPVEQIPGGGASVETGELGGGSVADVPEIGGVGLINTCTGELLEFISWGGKLCVGAYEDYTMAAAFETYTSTVIDTIQSGYSTGDQRTVQKMSCSYINSSALLSLQANCPADPGCYVCTDADGAFDDSQDFWVVVYQGGSATVPIVKDDSDCAIWSDQIALGGNCYVDLDDIVDPSTGISSGSFSNTIGFYNCQLDRERCLNSGFDIEMDFTDLQSFMDDGGEFTIWEMDDMFENDITKLIPNNYIITNHVVNVHFEAVNASNNLTVQDPSYLQERIIRYTIGSDLCGDTDSHFETNGNVNFWDGDVLNPSYAAIWSFFGNLRCGPNNTIERFNNATGTWDEWTNANGDATQCESASMIVEAGLDAAGMVVDDLGNPILSPSGATYTIPSFYEALPIVKMYPGYDQSIQAALIGSYETVPVYQYNNTAGNDLWTFANTPGGHPGGGFSTGNAACAQDINYCINGMEFKASPFWYDPNSPFAPWIVGQNVNIPTFYTDGMDVTDDMFVSYDNGVNFQDPNGTDVDGCFLGQCTGEVVNGSKFYVKDIAGYIFNGNRRYITPEGDGQSASGYGDSCWYFNLEPDSFRITISIDFTYEQCFPIGDFYGPQTYINTDNMDNPYWEFNPVGLSDQSPVEVTYDVPNANSLDYDEATDDLNCLDVKDEDRTQIIPINFSDPAELIDETIYVCPGNTVNLIETLSGSYIDDNGIPHPGTPATGQWSDGIGWIYEGGTPGTSETITYSTNIGTECFNSDDITIVTLGIDEDAAASLSCNEDGTYGIDISAVVLYPDVLQNVSIGGVDYGAVTVINDIEVTGEDLVATIEYINPDNCCDNCPFTVTLDILDPITLEVSLFSCTTDPNDPDGPGTTPQALVHIEMEGGSGDYILYLDGVDITSDVNNGLVWVAYVGDGVEQMFVLEDANAAGCTADGIVTVPNYVFPPLFTDGTTTACAGENVQLVVENPSATGTYNWYLDGALVAADVAVYNAPGVEACYYVSVTEQTANQLCISDLVPVCVELTDAVVATLVSEDCAEDGTNSAVVTMEVIGGDGTYEASVEGGEWDGNQYTLVLDGSTDYSVTFDSNGCSSEAVSGTTPDCTPVLDTDPDVYNEDCTEGVVITNVTASQLLDNDDSGLSVTAVYNCNDVAGVTIDDMGNGVWQVSYDGCADAPSIELCYDVEDGDGNPGDDIVIITYTGEVDCEFAVNDFVECSDDEEAGTYDLTITITGAANQIYNVNNNLTGTSEEMISIDGAVVIQLAGLPSDAEGYSYTITSGDCSETVEQLPVECLKTAIELVDFSGEVLTEGNLLEWTTASEIDNDYFTLERSLDGVTGFVVVNNIAGQGNSHAAIDYAEMDYDAPNGASYYRLLTTDFSGRTEVASNVVKLVRETEGFGFNNVKPIPTSGMLFVEFTSVDNTLVSAKVVDLAGKLVKEISVNAQAGINTFEIDMSTYAVGTYFLSISNGSETVNTKIIKD